MMTPWHNIDNIHHGSLTPHSDILSARKETVETKHILLKSMTSWLLWYKFFWISTRVLKVLLCPVFSSVICLHKVASLSFAYFSSRDMSSEACRNQASRFSLQAPHWPTRYDFGAGDIRIGQTKSTCISWNPGRNFENQMGCLSEANELQPGLVPSHCYLPATQKVTVL